MPSGVYPRRPAELRFVDLARNDGGDSCWEWMGRRRPDGYGLFWLDGRNVRAHRFAFEMFNGPVPDGLVLDHLCRNRGCVNPAHLEAVTNLVNIARGAGGQNNAVKTHCPRGHEYTEANTLYTKGRRNCRPCSTEKTRERRAAMRSARA